MELTATQLEFIDGMCTSARASVEARRIYTESKYKDHGASDCQHYHRGEVKDFFKAIIREWLMTRGLTAFIRSEIRVRSNWDFTTCQIALNATSIYNGKGGLPDGKNRWLNKITVGHSLLGGTRLRAHVVRTDADFLEPTATEFEALIQAIGATLAQ